MLITRLITFFEDVLKPPYLQCFLPIGLFDSGLRHLLKMLQILIA